MPRIRSIKPKAFRSIALASVPIPARWLFAGIWTEADDDGYLPDHPDLIRSQVLPLDRDVTAEQVEEWLTALADAGAVCRFTAAGNQFLHVLGWADTDGPSRDEWNQRISHASRSVVPPCPTCHPTVHDAPLLPILTVVPTRPVNPRRCPEHQTGHPGRCGACKEARLSYEEEQKSRPTFTARDEKCPDHPNQPAGRCPTCAAEASRPPADWRTTS